MDTDIKKDESVNTGVQPTAFKVVSVKLMRASAENKFKRDTLFFTLDKKFKVMQHNAMTATFEEVETNIYSMPRSAFEKVLIETSEDMAIFVSAHENGLETAEFAALMVASTVAMTSVKHLATEVINGVTLERDQWFNDIVNVVLSDRAKKFVEAKVDAIFAV